MTPDEHFDVGWPERRKAYAAGMTARVEGRTILACPIRGETVLSRHWVDGWYEAGILLRDGPFALA